VSAEPHLLTGAYAADALTETERLAFERHLEACPPCAAEARQLLAAAAGLGAAMATPPPAALWDRVRAEVAAADQVPSAAGPVGWRRRFPSLLAAAAALVVAVLSVTALGLGLVGGLAARSGPPTRWRPCWPRPTPGGSPAGPAGSGGPRWSSRGGGDRRCSWPQGWRRHRRPGPTSSGWWTARGRDRPGWSRCPPVDGSPGCWTGG
jgi:anti-sigma factor RsiW